MCKNLDDDNSGFMDDAVSSAKEVLTIKKPKKNMIKYLILSPILNNNVVSSIFILITFF